MAEESQISTFYAFKKVFVTGGTGFMGKVLIWKLLKSCPKLDTIYVLVRPKHGKTAKSRKEEFFGSPIFDNFKKQNPKILEKVVLVSGDVGQDELALSIEDRNTLIGQVSVVFHSAAILKMNSDLKTAVNINTVGTLRMLEMAKQMKNLEAFVYVSTAYCCCENSTVEEKIYPSKHNPYDIINLTRWIEPELLKKITRRMIHPLPNTYIYSKRLTESLLPDFIADVPIIVVRPSIVVPCFKDPIPGWNDSLNGPAGFLLAAGKGILRTSMMNLDAKSNIIPADMAINSILILPWANQREKLLKEVSVYNITQNSYENLIWRDITVKFQHSFEKYALSMMLWYPNFKPDTKCIFIYTIKCIFLHYLIAYMIDFILILLGQKRFLVRVHDKIRHGEKMLAYFTQRQWFFKNDKLLKLETMLNDEDKQTFVLNMKEIQDFQCYVDDICLMTKAHLFKEDTSAEGISKAKRIVKIMYVLDKIVLVLKYYFLWKILLYLYDLFFEHWATSKIGA